MKACLYYSFIESKLKQLKFINDSYGVVDLNHQVDKEVLRHCKDANGKLVLVDFDESGKSLEMFMTNFTVVHIVGSDEKYVVEANTYYRVQDLFIDEVILAQLKEYVV